MRRIALLLLLSSLCWGCDRAAEQTAARQAPAAWGLSSGSVEMGAGADELFESVSAGRIAADGRVVVADGGLLELRLYEPDGRPVVRFGKQGAGPREFNSIDGLWLQPDGRISVWDGGNQRISTFLTGGILDASEPISSDGLPSTPQLFFGSFSDGSALLATLQFGDRETADQVVPDEAVLARFGANGALRDTLGTIAGLWRTRFSPVPFSPVPRVLVRADSVWIAAPWLASLTVRHARGAVARTIELPWLPRFNGDTEHLWAALRDKLASRNKSVLLEMMDRVPRPDRFPAIAALISDEQTGQVWIRAYDPLTDALWLQGDATRTPAGGEWYILDAAGTQIASIQMPDSLSVLDVRDSHLLAIVRDEWDVERVVIRNIRR